MKFYYLPERSSGKSLYNLLMACYRYACEHIEQETPLHYYATKYCERDFILEYRRDRKWNCLKK